MNDTQTPSYIAFSGPTQIARGDMLAVALAAKAAIDADEWARVHVFDDVTASIVEWDLRGTPDDVAARYAQAPEAPRVSTQSEASAQRRAGRPKLGVVSREVTLLPRHWAWLADQPGGASVALRKLVEQASRSDAGLGRKAQEAAYRFMSVMAGNEPHFEDAARALFSGTQAQFESAVATWPVDVAAHARRLAAHAFSYRGA